MKRHVMYVVRTAMAVILLAGTTTMLAGCKNPFWFLFIPLFGK